MEATADIVIADNVYPDKGVAVRKYLYLVLFISLLVPSFAGAQDHWSWGQRTEDQTKTQWWTMQYDRRDQHGQIPNNSTPPVSRPFAGHDNGYRNGTTWNGSTGMQYPYGLRERRPDGWGTQPRRR